MKPEDRQRNDERSAWRTMALMSTVGLTLALSIGIGIGLGVLADQQFKTRGIGVIVGALIGIGAGFKELIRAVNKAAKDQEENDRTDREAGPVEK